MNEVIEVVESATDATINKAMLEKFLDRHVSKPFDEMFQTSVSQTFFLQCYACRVITFTLTYMENCYF